MTKLQLPYVQTFKDRHGKRRHYFRRAGFASVSLPGQVGSEEFMSAYARALQQGKVPPSKAARGTIRALILDWYQSAGFKSLSTSTQTVYRNIAERFATEHGDKTIANLRPRHVKQIISEKADKPAAANSLRKVIKALASFAMDEDLIEVDPTRDVKKVRYRSDGHHTWTEAEIAQFEAKWAVGTRARLAFALLLYTAQRRGDVVKMGKQHLRDGCIYVDQGKQVARLEIPIHPDLQEVIDKTPTGQMTFLTTARGAPFTSAGFGNHFRELCDEAGLPRCSAHGLRKAASRRLAEAGCSAHQIQAITGHASIAEVQRYTRAADQKRLARQALEKVERSKT